MLGTVDDSLERKLLQTWANQRGWIDLEVGVRDTIDGI